MASIVCMVCGMVEANSVNKLSTDLRLVSLLYGDVIIQLMGLTAIFGAIIVLLNYFTLPANLRHALAKKLTKNITLFYFAVIVYVAVFDIGFVRIKQHFLLILLTVLLPLVVLSAILIAYLVALQFSIKNLFKRKKKEKQQDQRQERQTVRDYGSLKGTLTRDYGSLEDYEPASITPSTHFTVPYTGQFTTITEPIQ